MCIKPLVLPDRIVPCSKCIECRQKRSSEWTFRLQEEFKSSKNAYFVTLTYSEENVPFMDLQNETVNTLNKIDVQNFIKRIRRNQYYHHGEPERWNEKIRYYLVGEYGPSTNRPHYHSIIFNLEKDIVQQLREGKHWKLGFTVVGDCNIKSIKYVTNYMCLKDENIIRGQVKPFALMSKNPIIGGAYIVNNYADHIEHEIDILKAPSKSKIPLYETYRRKIFSPSKRAELNKIRRDETEKSYEARMAEFAEVDSMDPLGVERKQRFERCQAKYNRMKSFKTRKI